MAFFQTQGEMMLFGSLMLMFKENIPRHSIVAWKAIQGRLLTRDRTFLVSIVHDKSCPFCLHAVESTDHLFFRCGYSAWVWRSILWRAGWRRRPLRSLVLEEEWLRLHFGGKGQLAQAMRISFQATIYLIWRERNLTIFENKKHHKTFILRNILGGSHIKINSSTHCHDLLSEGNIRAAATFGYKFSPRVINDKSCSWSKPHAGQFKISSDASLEENGAAIGGLIRSDDGWLLTMFSTKVSKAEIFRPELQAIEARICLALEIGISNIWIESDSLRCGSITRQINLSLEKYYHCK
ncbi:uncharacterized protein LOC143882831 [Tasmannia lanceolata]|uniref:uncharacterized protein LOC143882831 n=1 Tax=Tasmannia lanceolata TaxID=3420 RepID=UPI0040643F66